VSGRYFAPSKRLLNERFIVLSSPTSVPCKSSFFCRSWGLKGFAFLDAERDEHGHHHAVTCFDWLFLDDRMEPLPVVEAARLALIPRLAFGQ
jgi:hypothetical protein